MNKNPRFFALILLFSFFVAGKVNAEPNLETGRKLLKMDAMEAKALIETMSESDASSALSQIRALARPTNPDLDRAYYLLEHLERIRASELAQKRLNNLLLVIGTTMFLFIAYLTFILFSQRRILAKLGVTTSGKPAEKRDTVYRGE